MVRRWVEEAEGRWAASTRERVMGLVLRWEKKWGDLPLEAFTEDHIREYLRERVCGAFGMNQERMYLRQFLASIDKDTYLKVWKNRKAVVARRYWPLSVENEKKLLAVCGDGWLKRFVIVSVCTGWRERTVREARWEWVDENWWCTVPADAQKTGRASCIPLSLRVQEALGGSRGAGRLIPELPGASKLYKIFRKKVKEAGIPEGTSPHDLRRTFVKRARDSGAKLEEVMRLGGWKTVSTVLEHYFGPPLNAREIVEKL